MNEIIKNFFLNNSNTVHSLLTNLKFMINNKKNMIFGNSFILNLNVYILLYIIELIILSRFNLIYTANYYNKIPFYILLFNIFDHLSSHLILNYFKSGISFILIDTIFGKTRLKVYIRVLFGKYIPSVLF
jgi:hypothetical protein